MNGTRSESGVVNQSTPHVNLIRFDYNNISSINYLNMMELITWIC